MKFGKKLLDAATPEWAEQYVNYKRLKQLLKQAAEGGADWEDATARFLAATLKEVHKVNAFFGERRQACTRRLDAFSQQLPELLAALRAHPLPAEAGCCSLPAVLAHLGSTSAEAPTEDPTRAQHDARPDADAHVPRAALLALRDFVSLCDEIDALRKFCFVNFLAVSKIGKKHDKQCASLPLCAALVRHVSAQPFYSGTHIGALWTHAQCVVAELLSAACGREPSLVDYSCGICLSVLSMPVVLSCTHRFCYGCLREASLFDHHCPLCKRDTDLNPENYHIDGVLQRFLGEHFPPAAAPAAAPAHCAPAPCRERAACAAAAAAVPAPASVRASLELGAAGAGAEAPAAAPAAEGCAPAQQQPERKRRRLGPTPPPPGGGVRVRLRLRAAAAAPAAAPADGETVGACAAARRGASSAPAQLDARTRAAQLGLLQLSAPPAATREAEAAARGGACGPAGAQPPEPPPAPAGSPPSPAASPAADVGGASGPRKRACERCHRAKAACEGGLPCHRCARLGAECAVPEKRARGRRAAQPSPAHPRQQPPALLAAAHAQPAGARRAAPLPAVPLLGGGGGAVPARACGLPPAHAHGWGGASALPAVLPCGVLHAPRALGGTLAVAADAGPPVRPGAGGAGVLGAAQQPPPPACAQPPPAARGPAGSGLDAAELASLCANLSPADLSVLLTELDYDAL